jgi:hypothetical protein
LAISWIGRPRNRRKVNVAASGRIVTADAAEPVVPPFFTTAIKQLSCGVPVAPTVIAWLLAVVSERLTKYFFNLLPTDSSKESASGLSSQSRL